MHRDKFNETKFIKFWIDFVNPLKIQIINHRLNTRTQLTSRQPSLAILVSLIPFLFGFNQYINTQYVSIQRKYFFHKNLPGLKLTPEQINWDTLIVLNHINIPNSSIYWNNQSLLIQSDKKNRRFLNSSYNYKSRIFDRKNNESYSLTYNRTIKNNLILDLLPFKLQSNTIKNELNSIQPIQIHCNKQLSILNTDLNIVHSTNKIINLNTIKGVYKFKSTSPIQNKFDRKKFLQTQIPKFYTEVITKQIRSDSLKVLPTRLMSGYLYPDKLVQFSTTAINNVTNDTFEIKLPFSYLTNEKIKQVLPISPKFLIQTSLVEIDDNSPFQLLYSGPTSLVDSQTGFDWKFENSQQQIKFRIWLKNFLNSIFVSTQPLNNFFGLFDSSNNSSEFPIQNTLDLNLYWLNNLPVFKTGNFIQPNIVGTPNKNIVQFPYFSITKINSLLDSSAEGLSLPILQSNISTQNRNQSYLINTATMKPNFINAKIKTHYIQQNTASLNDDFTREFLTNGIYQYIPSILNINNSTTLFKTLWEPLTFKSWLVTAQIGFAFLVFKTLKALADNYGRELLVYLLDLVALLGFVDEELKQEIEILMGQKEKGFRIIKKTNKNFNNIGGIKHLIPEIIEIIWFLRNSGRNFSLSQIIPRGILLTGPPGTGKTLLVQAIAGEAEVPVIALSGSSLLEPGESGALKLELVFQEARQLAPCIVFIDEIDTLAEKREQVLQNPMGADEILEALITNQIKTENSGSESSQHETYKEKLRILMQFLIELDGIQSRSGVVVIGATNRPDILDPAVLRPGRFDRILEIGLPNAEKREEIFKLYSRNLGYDTQINWNYLIDRTVGFSSADIASIMNQSTLSAILNSTNHTIETIEFGIERTTTIGFEQPVSLKKTNLEIVQLAYYQVGKLLISLLLPEYPDVLITHLWPRRSNIRATQINKNLQTYFLKLAHRSELEERLIACYGGKAAEILFLENCASQMNLSDLGVEDINFAQNLSHLMVKNWHLYTKTISIQNESELLSNFNQKEYFGHEDELIGFAQLAEKNEMKLKNEIDEFPTIATSGEIDTLIQHQAQTFFSTAIWQAQISSEFEFSTRLFTDWYRIYLPDPQQIERNLEWIPPDKYYQNNLYLRTNADNQNWNSELQNSKTYLLNSLMLQSYNVALQLLDCNREILDFLVFKLLKDEIIRKPEIENIIPTLKTRKKKNFQSLTKINSNWGKNSRRQKSRKLYN
ncbi:ATP-dependent zinc metalloprotease FtsH (chloroplast) [Picochlorum sp. SENEW3]|nr:ATP-dependent zinc metalloprotease FtsH [Picochlorum sp. SENEW3]